MSSDSQTRSLTHQIQTNAAFTVLAGRIINIYADLSSMVSEAPRSIALIEQFDVSSIRDEHFEMPVLSQSQSKTIDIVPPKVPCSMYTTGF